MPKLITHGFAKLPQSPFFPLGLLDNDGPRMLVLRVIGWRGRGLIWRHSCLIGYNRLLIAMNVNKTERYGRTFSRYSYWGTDLDDLEGTVPLEG